MDRLPGALERLFRPEEVLGEGAHARVYRAVQRSLDRPVALKVLRLAPDAAADAVARFQEEAEVLSRVRHPGVVELLDFGVVGGHAYLAFPLEDTRTLEDELAAKGSLTGAAVARLVEDLLGGLEALHAAGVVHRDVKPANVLLSRDTGAARLIDLGLASDLATPRNLTATGEWVGTPAYASPDRILGEPIDLRDDLYSLGVLALEALTGENPFLGPSVLRTLELHANLRPPRLPGGCPPGLARLIPRLLEKRRERRPPDATAARALLARRDAPLPSGSPPASAPRTSTAELPAPPPAPPPPGPTTSLPARTRDPGRETGSRPAPPPPRVGGALLLVLGLATALGLAARAPSSAPTRPPPPAPPPAIEPAEETPGWLRDLRRELTGLDDVDPDPVRFDAVLPALPSLARFHDWANSGGRPELLPPGMRRQLEGLDREFRALGLDGPFEPYLEIADALPGGADLPPGAWADLAAREVAAVLETYEELEADLFGPGADAILGRLPFLRFMVIQGNDLKDIIANTNPNPEFRRRMLDWLRPGRRALRRALLALARAAVAAPAATPRLLDALLDARGEAPTFLLGGFSRAPHRWAIPGPGDVAGIQMLRGIYAEWTQRFWSRAGARPPGGNAATLAFLRGALLAPDAATLGEDMLRHAGSMFVHQFRTSLGGDPARREAEGALLADALRTRPIEVQTPALGGLLGALAETR